jgi:hypothetical protein
MLRRPLPAAPACAAGIARRGAGGGGLASVVIGGAFAWAGPMAYLLVTEGALAGGWATPWIWPGRPPQDLGAALCAYGVFAAGLAAVTLLGVRDSGRGRAGGS